MTVVDLYAASDETIDGAVDLDQWYASDVWGPRDCRRLWVLVLLMAVRDHFTEVGYLPGGGPDEYTCVADNVRYEMVPPRDGTAAGVIDAARRLVAPGWRAELRWLLAGLLGGRSVTRLVRTDIPDRAATWAVTVWEAGGRRGVHFRRLDALPPRPALPAGPVGMTWDE